MLIDRKVIRDHSDLSGQFTFCSCVNSCLLISRSANRIYIYKLSLSQHLGPTTLVHGILKLQNIVNFHELISVDLQSRKKSANF